MPDYSPLRQYKNRLRLRTAQGIGDTFWIQQKLLGEDIDWVIPRIKQQDLDCRAIEWLKIYPSTCTIEYPYAEPIDIHTMVQGSFELEDISDIQPYCLNAQLNRGVRIEDCFPKGRVAWNIKLPQTPIPLVAPEFDILFVCKAILSEHTRLNKKYGVWDIAKWVEFMNAFWTKFDKKPLVMIGADYDEKAIRRVAEYLEPDQLMLNAAPTDVLFLMSHCRWFLGYQSGMGIHADNLGCRQLMLYFNYLENLKYAWCQYPHENFHGHTFNTPIKTIIDSLPLNTPKIS